jgi:hypothetical protein
MEVYSLYLMGIYNTIDSFLASFSLRFRAFRNTFRLFIRCLRSLRAFFLSTMMTLPFGGGLLFEKRIGATLSRAASYLRSRIAIFPGVVGISSLRFHALRYACGPNPLPPLESLYRGLGGGRRRGTNGLS